MNYHELAQLVIGAGSTLGVFVLIGFDYISAEQGLGYVMAMLAGLGIGYTNGKKSNGDNSS